MRKGIIRISVGIALALFAGSLSLMPDIPTYESLEKVGSSLIGQTVSFYGNGQDETYLAAEMLGGQLYFAQEGERGAEQELVLEENRKEIGEGAVSANGSEVVGDVYREQGDKKTEQTSASVSAARTNSAVVEKLRATMDTEYLWNKFYIIDSTTSVTKNLFQVDKLLNRNMTLPKKKGKKQILIYHTHGASESFSDSKSGVLEQSIVGVGTELTKELEKRGYGVYHDKTQYDLINGKLERSLAYNKALEGIGKILEENPDIEVVIDLHRDSVGKGKHTYTTIQGKKTAIVMFFNGLSRTKSGEIAYLYNKNLQANLAFSLQLKCMAMECYDGFTKPIYLKGYRYNLHVKERSLLIELGNENNTVEEAKNAAAPLSDVLDKVLSGTSAGQANQGQGGEKAG